MLIMLCRVIFMRITQKEGFMNTREIIAFLSSSARAMNEHATFHDVRTSLEQEVENAQQKLEIFDELVILIRSRIDDRPLGTLPFAELSQ